MTVDINDIIPGELRNYNTLAKQLTAVKKNGHAVQWIRNPSLDVQLAAVRQNGFAIGHIKNPSELVQLEALKVDGSALYWILAKRIVPSIAVQRAAVLQNPVWALNNMTHYNIPISKMIQWTAAKRIKERDMFDDLGKGVLEKLDPDVQNYLRSDKL